jgi:hypothetical protein
LIVRTTVLIIDLAVGAEATQEFSGLSVGALSIGFLALLTRAGFVVLPRHLEALAKNLAVSSVCPRITSWVDVDQVMFEHRSLYDLLACLRPVPGRNAFIRKHERQLARIIVDKVWAGDRADASRFDQGKIEGAAEEEDEVVDRAVREVQP